MWFLMFACSKLDHPISNDLLEKCFNLLRFSFDGSDNKMNEDENRANDRLFY